MTKNINWREEHSSYKWSLLSSIRIISVGRCLSFCAVVADDPFAVSSNNGGMLEE